ncbi:hypothetical protein Pan258_46150 [Symmachiella dynata]|nr:hypothetical protein Pan258_46150 [Symmachiella dynata]
MISTRGLHIASKSSEITPLGGRRHSDHNDYKRDRILYSAKLAQGTQV